jgi:DNA repair photolyase
MKFPDSWFWAKFTMNSYSGCEHACIYCDARSQRYYLHSDFEETIYYKQNAPELLKKKLQNSRTMIPDVVAMAGVCDAYQPAEKKFEITRKSLKILQRFKYPVNISTKNTLILRDLDIFDQIAKRSWVSLAFTITSVNQEVTNFLEPRASPVKDRFEAISFIAKKYPSIQVGVNFMPIIPILEDDPKEIEELIKKCKDAGAKYIHCSPGMTLRDSQEAFFLAKLKKYFSARNELTKFQQFVEIMKNFQNASNYMFEKNQVLQKCCKKYKISMRSQRWYPSDYRNMNYKASEKLLNLAYFNQINRKNYKDLMWAGLQIQNLPDSIGNLVSQKILPNFIKISPKILEQIQQFIKPSSNLDQFL